MVDHWHGITLMGALNCRIVNNTVVDLNTQTPGPPWISIDSHKNGTKASGCVIRNNLTTSVRANTDVQIDHNIIINNYDTFFIDYPAYNLQLKKGCPAIGSGSRILAPETDRNGQPRSPASIDVGAYQFSTTSHTLLSPRLSPSLNACTDHLFDLKGRSMGTYLLKPKSAPHVIITVNGKKVAGGYHLYKRSEQKRQTQ